MTSFNSRFIKVSDELLLIYNVMCLLERNRNSFLASKDTVFHFDAVDFL